MGLPCSIFFEAGGCKASATLSVNLLAIQGESCPPSHGHRLWHWLFAHAPPAMHHQSFFGALSCEGLATVCSCQGLDE